MEKMKEVHESLLYKIEFRSKLITVEIIFLFK